MEYEEIPKGETSITSPAAKPKPSGESKYVKKKKTFREKAHDFGLTIFNPRKKTVLNRTCGSWAKIGIFYIIYYGLLAGFWAAMLQGFFVTIDDTEPRLQDHQSLIKYNPGMGYRPQPDIDRTLIDFAQGDPESYADYTKNLDKYLEAYSDVNQTERGLIDCDPEDPNFKFRDPNLACKYPLSNLGDECTKEKHYGYDVGRPCVLLKMNKLFNWVPEPFANDSVPENLPNYNPGFIPVTCTGRSEADVDNIGPVTIYPSGGFDASYFPYHNQKGYLAPVVMAQFTRPRWGTLVVIFCRVWASNIYHDDNDRAGSVQFELLMD